MNRRKFMSMVSTGTAIAALAKLTGCLKAVQSNSDKIKPNIVLIESDDQYNYNIHGYGNPDIVTPNLDALMQSGTSFINAYNMGGYREAICVPSRTMMHTGTFVWEANKIKKNGIPGPMLSTRLKDAGYDTYMTGKWHVDGKSQKSCFQYLGTIMAGQLDTYWTSKGHATDVTGDEAVNFINQAKDRANPFFMLVGFNASHTPREEPQSYFDMYNKKSLTLLPCLKESGKHPYVSVNFAPKYITFNWARNEYQRIYGQITHMDKKIGDIVQALKNTGQYNNTVIIFISDQGDLHGEHGIVGKVNMYDLSVKAPLIISGPRIAVSKKVDTRVYIQDLHPTILELAGAAVGSYVDFKSLNPILQGKTTASPYESIYLAFLMEQRGVVYGDYKLMLYNLPDKKVVEFYNLKNDPYEMNDISKQSGSQAIMNKLFAQLLKWQKKQADPLDINATWGHLFD